MGGRPCITATSAATAAPTPASARRTRRCRRRSRSVHLSRRSIREKLLCYFGLLAGQRQKPSFQLPFSLSALADYISADRSAMMRELKKMKDEHLVEVAGRQVTLCTPAR